MPPFHPLVRATILVVLQLLAARAGAHAHESRSLARYARVFCFGDSLTDTGNGAILPLTAGGSFTQPPYGETYFGHPTGRASDGRLLIDFLVEELKVPQPTLYLAGRTAADFLNGTNFALGGSTALHAEFLASRGITSLVPISLSNETTWFKDVVQQLDSSGYAQDDITASSVFFIGEVGYNDYLCALMDLSPDAAASLLPHIIGAIHSALTAMVSAGARTVVVAGMLPLGCEPQLLAMFPEGILGDYDPASGCIVRLNELAEQHNRALRLILGDLQCAHPDRFFLYIDVYGPILSAVTSPAKYGFGDIPLAACCGCARCGGDPYNMDPTATVFCGMPVSNVCADPSKFISWDGIHYTEAANRLVAREMQRGLMRRAGRGPAIGASCGHPSAPAMISLIRAE